METIYMVYRAGTTYMGQTPEREQAVEAAKMIASQGNTFADVVRHTMTAAGATARRVRYHADGTTEKLWQFGMDQKFHMIPEGGVTQ